MGLKSFVRNRIFRFSKRGSVPLEEDEVLKADDATASDGNSTESFSSRVDVQEGSKAFEVAIAQKKEETGEEELLNKDEEETGEEEALDKEKEETGEEALDRGKEETGEEEALDKEKEETGEEEALEKEVVEDVVSGKIPYIHIETINSPEPKKRSLLEKQRLFLEELFNLSRGYIEYDDSRGDVSIIGTDVGTVSSQEPDSFMDMLVRITDCSQINCGFGKSGSGTPPKEIPAVVQPPGVVATGKKGSAKEVQGEKNGSQSEERPKKESFDDSSTISSKKTV